MSKAKPATKAQTEAIVQHCVDPTNYPQVAVMRKLRLKSHNDFYRLYYKVHQAAHYQINNK